jgi:hypothetical protein
VGLKAECHEEPVPGKRVFLGLILAGFGILVLISALTWYLIEPRLVQIHTALPALVGWLTATGLFLIAVETLLFMITAVCEKDVLYPRVIKALVAQLFFPIVLAVGRVCGFSKQRIRQSFISVNNAIVRAGRQRLIGQRLLILLPQCLQNTACKRRITTDIANCVACGECTIGRIKALAEHYQATVAVATGGTLARRVIVETRPTVILAVACDRDLTSGIQYAHRIPTLGVLNRQPQGPCVNTQVDLDTLEHELEFITRGRAARRPSVAPAYPVTARSES